ncbi:23S ribosomal RNA methyltransferase [mine drainage metagenome]|uniref:23S ribosomal RNA methyltransferase n=1 Tax=mine drainage metagenome TaxID=410659 RepID=T0YNV6_9ZZZZ
MTARRDRRWMVEHLRDPYVRQARQEGYRTRASYKLVELDEREHLIRAGQIVLDLGAAPGGWSQYARRAVGPAGRVIAVDRLPLAGLEGVDILECDLREARVVEDGLRALGIARGEVGLVLSDMAPNISGDASVDQAQILELGMCALDLARNWLAPGGAFLFKFFQGSEFPAMRAALERDFARVKHLKPRASRARSAELYFLARKRRLV